MDRTLASLDINGALLNEFVFEAKNRARDESNASFGSVINEASI